MQITKNRQPKDTIKKLVINALGNKEIISIEELSEGMLNIAYRVSFSDKTGVIIKIAPAGGQGIMSNEIALMDAEINAMRIMDKYNFTKVAQVQYYDKSLKLCNGAYFIIEQLDGENYYFSQNDYTDNEKSVIHKEIGLIQKNMTKITNEKFGLLGDDRRFDSLYDFFMMLMQNLLSDIEKRNIKTGVENDQILDLLCHDRDLFSKVKSASLVHWDMWEGNVFVKDKHVIGIIDWERAMWGEPYMDDRFRKHSINNDFLEGFGKTAFSDDELRRMRWYDLFLYATMIAEVTYRQYEDKSQLEWVQPLFDEAWHNLT